MPSDSDFATLEALNFVSVMKPLVDITEAIGGEKWITISTIRPILHKLLQSHLLPSPNDNQLVKTIKKVLLTDLQGRYTGETLQFLTKATILDPRFKSLKFIPRDSRTNVVSDLQQDIDLVHNVTDVPEESGEQPTAKKPKGEKKLMHILEEIVELNDDDCDLPPKDERLSIEISIYLGEEPTVKSPMLFHIRMSILTLPVQTQEASKQADHEGIKSALAKTDLMDQSCQPCII